MTSVLTQFRAALVAVILATPAAAQQLGDMVRSDLNGDGRIERITLRDSGQGTVDLHIENTGGAPVIAPGIAWVGGIGQQPELSLAPNGSVRLTSMNESIGRSRWHLTLTIAYRNRAYRVAGYTYDWYDTIDIADSGFCDLNLLSGRGYTKRGESATKHPVRTTLPAMPITEWTDNIPIPTVCGRD